MSFELTDFDVSPDTGFLPKQAPPALRKDCFSQWERVAENLPQLIQEKKLREKVDSLPETEFSMSTLETEDEWKRAYVILSFLGQAYIWMSGENVVNKVPKILAVPWVDVSRRLKVNPVINYAASVLYNYQLKDQAKPIDVDNLRTLLSFTGSTDESWFFMVHAATEVAAGPGLKAIVQIFQQMAAKDHASVLKSLAVVRSSINNMKGEVQKMRKGCNPRTFYNDIRPFVSGSMNVEALPDGIIFDGVYPNPPKYRGASAAQTSSVYAFDMFLGTKHSDQEQRDFVTEMRDYMPELHRDFLEKLDTMPPIREYCESSGDPGLIAGYNDAVESLVSFRDLHIGIVTSYVLKPSGYTAKYGTGGSPLEKFLEGVKKDTIALKITTPS